MDTLEQNGARFERMPLREDGTVDLNELARSLLEGALNAAMDAAADELLGEGNRRNGYRERELRTCVGTVTLRIPKLREGSYFPTRWSGRTRAPTGRWWRPWPRSTGSACPTAR